MNLLLPVHQVSLVRQTLTVVGDCDVGDVDGRISKRARHFRVYLQKIEALISWRMKQLPVTEAK